MWKKRKVVLTKDKLFLLAGKVEFRFEFKNKE
jgi:hypothetical protein